MCPDGPASLDAIFYAGRMTVMYDKLSNPKEHTHPNLTTNHI